jgi:hypothetical protein
MPDIIVSRKRAKDEKLQAHRQSDNEYIVYNPTSKSQYSVIKSANGTWYCTCPFAVKGSHIGGAICKHLSRVLDKEAGCLGCGAKNVRLENQHCVHCRMLDRMGF